MPCIQIAIFISLIEYYFRCKINKGIFPIIIFCEYYVLLKPEICFYVNTKSDAEFIKRMLPEVTEYWNE